jgi:hypothetical protein
MELGSSNNTIGGTTASARNVISANGIEGIELDESNSDLIEGNYIGTDATGTKALGNATYGIDMAFVFAQSTIGGTVSGAANVISGNGSDGVIVRTGAHTLLEGNLIGTDATGTRPRGNAGNGIRVFGGSATIGGSAAGAGNLVSANVADGIRLQGSSNELVQGNKIGTDISGTMPLGNGGNGVRIDGSNNTIGGAGSGNIIDFNALDGVFVNSGTGDLISQNSIFANGGLGIELNAANNANNSQAAPVLTAAVSAHGMTLIVGSLTSTPNTTFTLEFFANTASDPSGFGEGQTFLGSITVTTDSEGIAHFTARFAVMVPPGEFIAATATDPNNDTSEFSNSKIVRG